jgi:hypothetical protein
LSGENFKLQIKTFFFRKKEAKKAAAHKTKDNNNFYYLMGFTDGTHRPKVSSQLYEREFATLIFCLRHHCTKNQFLLRKKKLTGI